MHVCHFEIILARCEALTFQNVERDLACYPLDGTGGINLPEARSLCDILRPAITILFTTINIGTVSGPYWAVLSVNQVYP